MPYRASHTPWIRTGDDRYNVELLEDVKVWRIKCCTRRMTGRVHKDHWAISDQEQQDRWAANHEQFKLNEAARRSQNTDEAEEQSRGWWSWCCIAR